MTFGSSRLLGGINLAPTMIGMFAFSQVIKKVYNAQRPDAVAQDFTRQSYPWKQLFSYWKVLLKSILIGTGSARPGYGTVAGGFCIL